MPIDIQCPQCLSKYRVADQFAGKRAKCAKCKAAIPVPATGGPPAEPSASGMLASSAFSLPSDPPAAAEGVVAAPAATEAAAPAATTPSLPPAGAADEWRLQTVTGEQYVPANKDELDQWVAEGRVDASCQVLCSGWDQWRSAAEVYPQLVAVAAISPRAISDSDVLAAISDAALESRPSAPRPEAVAESEYTMQAPGHAAPQPVAAATVRRPNYPALQIISRTYEILAWVAAGLGALAAFILGVTFLVALFQAGRGEFIPAFILSEGVVLLITFLAWLSLKAAAEFIRLAIDVADDVHATADAVRRPANSANDRASP